MTKFTKFKIGFYVSSFLAVLIFLIQNSSDIEVNFLFFNILKFNLIVLLLLFFTLGGVAGISSYLYLSRRKDSKQN
jgi:uncharacterized integral membrane protein